MPPVGLSVEPIHNSRKAKHTKTLNVYLPRAEKKSGFRNAITGFLINIVDKQ